MTAVEVAIVDTATEDGSMTAAMFERMRTWFRRGMTRDLPDRVRLRIRREQEESEVLVGWVQMGIVATFGALYALAPKTFDAAAPFQPVPWTLGAYFLFVILRLGLAYRRRLAAWFLSLSVVIDIAMLLVLIWSFHLQYQQPPAFYLKAPTMLYVFIFIALRALRFEARYVLLAGAVAAIGWLGLVYYAIAFDPVMPVTRDYVRYLTSSTVLLGAEFDKVISIIVVTMVMAVVIVRARRLLVNSVTEQAAVRELSRFFDPEIANRIVGSAQEVKPGQGEMRDAAALFTDLRGFTSLVKMMPPAEMIELLGEYQSRMVPVIQRHGGSIDKFLGDGIMASFGAALKSDSYAADALRAVDDLARAARDWAVDRQALGKMTPGMGMAVAVGPVIFGAIGDATRLEYTVIGDTVNLAAKLEKHTKVERVQALATHDALILAEQQGYVAPTAKELRPGREVVGVEHLVDLVVLAPGR